MKYWTPSWIHAVETAGDFARQRGGRWRVRRYTDPYGGGQGWLITEVQP